MPLPPAHVFFDLETTGLDSERDVITEIGYIFDDTERHFYVPFDGFPSLWVARNTVAFEIQTPTCTLQRALRELFKDCLELSQGGSRDVYLVGACPAFDDRFLRKVFREVPYHYHLIDVEAVAMGAFGWDTPKPLRHLREALCIPGANAKPHDALEDAREVKIIWDALHDLWRARGLSGY
jgi:oligoribonuclease (3'-5' exoribonuclease)